MVYCVDCRVDERLENNFLTLNLCGKPVFLYVIEKLFKIKNNGKIYVLTNSAEVEKIYASFYRGVQFVTNLPNEKPFLVFGRAVLLKSNTIEKAVKKYKPGSMYSVKNDITIDFNQLNNYISFIKENNHDSINAFLITDGNKEVEKSFILNQSESVVINTTNDFELA